MTGMIVQGGLKLEIRISNSNTWKRHLQHPIGLFVFIRSSHQIIGGKRWFPCCPAGPGQ